MNGLCRYYLLSCWLENVSVPSFLTIIFTIAAKLYLPKVNRSSGAVIDMWIKVHTSFNLSVRALATLPLIFWTFFS